MNSTTVSLGVVNMTFALRNDTAKGPSLDCRSHFQVVGADFLGSAHDRRRAWQGRVCADVDPTYAR